MQAGDPVGAEGGGGEGGAGGGGLEWEDRLSWEDSERFDEDSLCSWMSEESTCQNWRGWEARGPSNSQGGACSYTGGILNEGSSISGLSTLKPENGIPSLKTMAAQTVARSKSFEEMEQFFRSSHLNIPIFAVDIQEMVFKHCFPQNEEDIRLYSCLANGNAEEFQRGDTLYKAHAAKDLLQIGYHLSAIVDTSAVVRSAAANGSGVSEVYSVSMTADRCRITSCVCSCNPGTSWCSHVVAVCLQRMHNPRSVQFRPPLSESVNQLNLDQLRKCLLCLMQELPRQILPTGQKLIDLLKDPNSEENMRNGAPDPTAGGPQDDPASWCLNDQILKENIKKILTKFCVPSPTVFSDVNGLSSSVPPVTNEWMVLLRPLRGREPEGLWNLLSIVREMYRRRDYNATELLHIITIECLTNIPVMLWWYQTKLSQSGTRPPSSGLSSKSGTSSNQYSCASLCDEIVHLWRLAALNPILSPAERDELHKSLIDYHTKTVEKVWTVLKTTNSNPGNGPNVAPNVSRTPLDRMKFDLDAFPGFKSAVRACLSDWDEHRIEGVTYKTPSQPQSTNIPSSYAELSVSCSSVEARDFVSPRAQSSCSPTLPVIRDKNQSRRPKAGSTDLSSEIGSARPSLDGFPNPAEAPCTSNNVREPVNLENMNEVERIYLAPVLELANHPENGLANINRKPESSGERRDPVKESEQELLLLTRETEPLEVEFSRCESLYVHGYAAEACELAVKLARNLTKAPPNLMEELPGPIKIHSSHTPNKPGRKPKKKISEEFVPHPKAIDNSMMATGILQKTIFLFDVLLKETGHHHLAFEIGLFALELPRQPAATKFLEVKMNQQEASIVAALKKITLGPDDLNCLRQRADHLRNSSFQMRSPVLPFSLANYIFDCLCVSNNPHLFPTDDLLGFEAAVSALGMKTCVSEAEHPLLCEGIRRQRGDLAISLFSKYKDSMERVAMIMDRLLDPDMHMMFRTARSNAAYYLRSGCIDAQRLASLSGSRQSLTDSDDQQSSNSIKPTNVLRSCSGVSDASVGFDELVANIDAETGQIDEDQESIQLARALENIELSNQRRDCGSRDPSPKQSTSSESSSSGISRGIQAEAAVPSLTASAAASPPLMFTAGPGEKSTMDVSTKPLYSRGQRSSAPCVPNQASEAHAHFMTELAKRLLNDAGVTQSTAIFLPQNAGQPQGPNRNLHLCAFQIGLYALGLHNKVTPNWLSRTYSSNSSWICGQAIEIGRTAIKILIDTWENHLTPMEAAMFSDNASQGRDSGIVSASAELCLSVMPFANALNPRVTKRALTQCREHSRGMLEKACLAVEQAAREASGGVYPEVLFDVARHWHDLHKERAADEANSPQNQINNQHHHQHNHQNMRVAQEVAGNVNGNQNRNNLLQGIAQPNVGTHPFAAAGQQFNIPPGAQFGIYGNQIPPALAMYQQAMSAQQLALQHPNSFQFNFQAMLAAQNGGFPPVQYLPGGQPGGQFVSPRNFALPFMNLQQNARPVHVSQSAPNLIQQHPRHNHHPPGGQHHQQLENSRTHSRYLEAAYRVGIFALQTLGRSLTDERSHGNKYAQNPPYGDNVKWLFNVSKELSPKHVEKFCITSADSVPSPFLLWGIVEAAAEIFPLQVSPVMMGPTGMMLGPSYRYQSCIQSLVDRCLTMFQAAAKEKLSHPKFVSSDLEEIKLLVKTTKAVYSKVFSPNDYVRRFEAFMSKLKTMKAARNKETWAIIQSVSKEEPIRNEKLGTF